MLLKFFVLESVLVKLSANGLNVKFQIYFEALLPFLAIHVGISTGMYGFCFG